VRWFEGGSDIEPRTAKGKNRSSRCKTGRQTHIREKAVRDLASKINDPGNPQATEVLLLRTQESWDTRSKRAGKLRRYR